MILKPKVTVITIVLNDADGFLITTRSVIHQDYKNIEWIVIDGLSIDNTSSYIKNLSPAISHYKIEKDTGIYNAMNKGIDLVSGDWVIFMNADDAFYDSSTISSYVENMREDDEILYADVIRREDGMIHQHRPHDQFWAGMIFDHQTACIKAGIYKKYKYDESLKIAGDLDFLSKARIKKHKFRKIPCLKACIKPFDVGASSAFYDRQRERVIVLRRYFNDPRLITTLNAEFKLAFESKIVNRAQYNNLLSLIGKD
jgi:glycosyltransferase involved in cell wall biosynthesis